MVKLAKGPKTGGKPKKAAPPPPKDVDDSEEEDSEEEEDDSSEEEEVPQKKAVTPAKTAGTPGKKGATPATKTDTPAKPANTPGKKAAAAKNGKKAQKKDSSDEDDDDDEEEETEVVEEEEEAESESEEETTPAKKLTPKKPADKVKKPSKKKGAKEEDSEEEEGDDDGDEGDSDADMDTTPAPAKGKPAAAKTKESSDEEDGDEEMEEEEEEDDDDEEEKVTVKDSGKRKKEVPKEKTPEAKKPKKEGAECFSLFVANLNAEKDFDELKDAIRKFFTKKNFTVADVRLGQSKKFGYVDFSSEEDLEKAVGLSGKKILGLETKMEKARSKEDNMETKKERNLRTIFVKNLPYSATSDTLQELFENAVEVRIPMGGNGSNRGVAYIEFKSEAEAEKALEEKQGADVEGRSIVLDFTGDKAGTAAGGGGAAAAAAGGVEQKVLVINNLAYSVTESALQEVFEKAVSCKIPQNNQGRPKGFAFVEFTSAEDCKEALKTHNNTEIEGRAVRLELKGAQQGGRGSGQTKTLFVRGLSEDTTEESLKESFEGAVSARIAMDRETGSSKGFGFVDFSTVEEAKAAKEAMEDGEIDGNKVTLDFAKPKGDSGRGGFGRGGGGRGFGRGRGFGGRGGGRGGGGRGGGRGFGGGYGGGRGGGGGGGFRGGNRGKKIRFDD